MTLPSEGINPWRAAPTPGGPGANAANHAPAKLPDLDVNPQNSLDAPEKTAGGKEFKAFGDDGVTFWDLVDVVNPLQHIPIVSSLYRDLTNDTLDPAPRVMGGTLFMGPIGLVASVANVLVEHNTGKDMGSHVMAYFKDDAGPLSTATAAVEPAAAGTDGSDPVTRWAAEQNAFYNKDKAADDAVTRWAAEQHAYYRDGAEQPAAQTAQAPSVSDWARQQHAYYRGETPSTSPATQVADASGGPAAAGTDGVDLDAWVADQHAYYQHGNAGTTAANDVSRWAQSQHAYYRAGAEAAPAKPQPAAVQTAQTRTNGTSETVDVSTWARDQLAWVMGDRAKEMAALPAVGRAATERTNTDQPDRRDNRAPSGAVAENGGWFSDNMVRGWTQYQAAQQLADPSYRPDLAVAAERR